VGVTQGVYEKGMKRSDNETKMLAAVAALKYETKGMKTTVRSQSGRIC
jgi:hypothetical protein